jgi:plastocyanin
MLLFLIAGLVATTGATAQPTVRMQNMAFVPATITVAVDQPVAFENDDDDAHTVTAVDGSFDSKGLDTHQHWTHAFAKPGRYEYFCSLHPFMKGTIIVKAVHS